ncbi:unnamed protein product [Adineta ricciae]|uniref:Uncharacterized protein n=1 Tax=Adineta ricciae TaxID=249248 RepID=A0A816C0X8_ADIRI|nr:unnamed protein product [Adineta ricciae]
MHVAKIVYFTVFVLAIMAFIFHATAMGHHHWKHVTGTNITLTGFNRTTIGLFMRCVPSDTLYTEVCFPNTYPVLHRACKWSDCQNKNLTENCGCDYLPSTKGIAACTILAAVFLGISIILLFIHSIRTNETRVAAILLSFLPLILLLLTFIFMLIALILVGSYLSRDMMAIYRTIFDNESWEDARKIATQSYSTQIGWASGLEIIALVLTFLSFVFYCLFVFKLSRTA